MPALRIYDPRERALVAAADAVLAPIAWTRRIGRRPPAQPSRVLCFRLERIGDLLMTLPALAVLRDALPAARIDLVVGSWNREVAEAIPGLTQVETLDAAWLARGPADSGPRGDGVLSLRARAAAWKPRRYDLAINFEPDIRSNFVLGASGAEWTAGFASGGGGAWLDLALDHDPAAHTADNAVRLVRRTLGLDDAPLPSAALAIPDAAREAASRLLDGLAPAPRIGLHVGGGRAIKQWPEARFRELAVRLVHERGAAIVLTGTPGERAQIDQVRAALPPDRVIEISGASLLTVAAVQQQLDLFVTGDTGPMHLAHAVGTPIVAVFGPSDPMRYAPRGLRDHVVRVDLPCSPCNRIRRPPARCTGGTPDCLAGISTDAVMSAIDACLERHAR
jgi:ADP-heptose:LPS heptosyltransferase